MATTASAVPFDRLCYDPVAYTPDAAATVIRYPRCLSQSRYWTLVLTSFYPFDASIGNSRLFGFLTLT